MADNNVVRFRRPEKKPDKPTNSQGPAPRGPRMSPGRLSLVAWAVILAVSIAFVAAQHWGLMGA